MGGVLAWVACLRGRCASVGSVGGVLVWVAWVDMNMNRSQSQCGQICLDMCNFVNMPEYT